MEDGRPDSDPGHKSWVQRHVISFYNIEDRIIEQGYQSRNAHDSQRLCTQNTEDDARQRGGKQRFIHAVEATGATVHIEYKRQSWQNTTHTTNINVRSLN